MTSGREALGKGRVKSGKPGYLSFPIIVSNSATFRLDG